MSINPPRLQRPRLPLMRELSPQATEGEKSFDFIRIYIQHRIFTISLPQSASLTAPSSEGAVCTVSLFRQTETTNRRGWWFTPCSRFHIQYRCCNFSRYPGWHKPDVSAESLLGMHHMCTAIRQPSLFCDKCNHRTDTRRKSSAIPLSHT